jgi:hypothetical protein
MGGRAAGPRPTLGLVADDHLAQVAAVLGAKGIMADVRVEPQKLAVSALCDTVSTVPPAQAFGQLPQSKTLADALSACVRLTADDLNAAVAAAERIYSGLNLCATGYSDTDSAVAGDIVRMA